MCSKTEKLEPMEENLNNQETPSQSQGYVVERKNRIRIALLGFAEIILILGSFYAGLKYSQNKEPSIYIPPPTPTSSLQQPAKPPETTPISEVESTIVWRNYQNFDISFDYPNGWHVFINWIEKQGDPTEILLGPEPLNNIPREGPISTILIEDFNYFGSENPNTVLEKNLSYSRENITDLKETFFMVRGIKVYKLEGKVEFFGEVEPALEYHTILQGNNTNNANTHVIKASLFSSNETYQNYSEILDKIVRSLKLKNQQ